MKSRILVQVVAATVVIVFAVGIWSTGGQVHLGWLRFFSAAVVAATALLWLWDRLLWNLGPVQRVRSVPRDVSGTWKGTLTSLWQDVSTGKGSPPPKPAYLVVRQTAWNVSAILLTDESRSMSSLAVVSGTDGTASLDYVYLNHPDSRFEDRSRIHHGSALLDISGRPAKRLRGRYWTDRNSGGELDFRERKRKIVDDFDDARALFS